MKTIDSTPASCRRMIQGRPGCLVAMLALLGLTTSAVADTPRLLNTSPKGTYRIERVDVSGEEIPATAAGEREWIVSNADSTQRAMLPKHEGDQLYDVRFSADEKWIAANVHYGSRLAGVRLFRQKDGVKYDLVLDEKPAWIWLDHQKADAMSAADMLRYATWSSDSSRLMLRIPVGGEAIAKGTPTAEYFFYYNLREQRFEMTDYLRRVNREALRILHSAKPEQLITEAHTAEPMDKPPSIDSSRARYETADAKLNKIYSQLMKELKQEDQSMLRKEQRDWIKLRDAGAEAFAMVRRKEDRPAYRQHYLAESTVERARDLEDILKRVSE